MMIPNEVGYKAKLIIPNKKGGYIIMERFKTSEPTWNTTFTQRSLRLGLEE